MLKQFCAEWILSKITTPPTLTDPLAALDYVRQVGYEPVEKMVELVEFMCQPGPLNKHVEAVLNLYPRTYDTWDMLQLHHMFNIGKGILKCQADIVAKLVATACEVTVWQVRVPVVNTTIFREEVALEICKNRPFGVVFSVNTTEWSLLIQTEGELAKAYELAEPFSEDDFYKMLKRSFN